MLSRRTSNEAIWLSSLPTPLARCTKRNKPSPLTKSAFATTKLKWKRRLNGRLHSKLRMPPISYFSNSKAIFLLHKSSELSSYQSLSRATLLCEKQTRKLLILRPRLLKRRKALYVNQTTDRDPTFELLQGGRLPKRKPI